MYSFAGIALVVHFIPILTGGGIDGIVAAKCAAAIGIISICGRLATGAALDRLPGSWIGATALLLPPVGCLILLVCGINAASAAIAASLIGLTLGAEVGIIVYLATRHFGLKNFGALYGGILIALAIGSSGGPLAAAWLFDLTGNYTQFLRVSIGLMLMSAVALATLPQPAPLKTPS